MLTTNLLFELTRGGKSVFSNGVKLGIMFKSSWLKYKTLHLLCILLFGYSVEIFFSFGVVIYFLGFGELVVTLDFCLDLEKELKVSGKTQHRERIWSKYA